MPIMNYFSSKNGTLGQRLDHAWEDYKEKQLTDDEHEKALEFLIYAFDIQLESIEKNSLNNVLIQLMDEREKHKKKGNSYYVPMFFSGPYQFNKNAKILQATSISMLSSEQAVQSAFKEGKLLDVNPKDKRRDRIDCVTYLTAEQRAAFNIEIYKGLFYKEGHLFDSSNLIAHRKKGYVAFTLNTNGELSVFEHLGGRDDHNQLLAHSSMNAGAPVLLAGEIEIRNGKLMSINTYSGHYDPSLYSIVLFLRFLCNKGMDISKTKIFLQNKPGKESALNTKKVYIPDDPYAWYQIAATELVTTVDQMMKSDLESINDYLSNNKKKFYSSLFRTKLAHQKIQLGKIFQREIQGIFYAKNHSTSQVLMTLEKLEKIIDIYIEAYKKIDPSARSRLGKKFAEMKYQLKQVKEQYEGESTDARDQLLKNEF